MFEVMTTTGGVPPTISVANARPKILVVDDARYIRELLKLHLTNAGYDVETAEDAVVAARRVLENAPDLLITDVNMPYMDGIEFVRAIRSDPAFTDMPILFITSREDIASDAAKLGAVACFTKPVRVDRLLEVAFLYLAAPPGR